MFVYNGTEQMSYSLPMATGANGAMEGDCTMARELSERQQKMIEFLREFIAENRFPPTIREIGKKVGISSTSVVKYNLDALQTKGYIERDSDISRGIRLVGDLAGSLVDRVQVPLLGRIAAGAPIPVPDTAVAPFDSDSSIELTRDIVKDVSDTYALEVQGDSMIDALINDGDIVLMRHQKNVENGELAAVWLREQEETTLKRFYLEGSRVRLQPANPTMKAIFFPAEAVEVQGKVLCVIRQMN
jgi:repressor LexA